MGSVIDKKDFFSKRLAKVEFVPLVEFFGTDENGEPKGLYVRDLSIKNVDYLQSRYIAMAASKNPEHLQGLRVWAVQRGVCTEAGGPFFDDNDKDAIETLPADLIDKLYARITELSGMNKQGAERATGEAKDKMANPITVFDSV